MRRPRLTLAATALCCAAGVAQTPPATPFDGEWRVTMDCPVHTGARDEARGYKKTFPATITAGQLQGGTGGGADEPGTVTLSGTVQADGSALLRFTGIVNNADYAVGHSGRGKPYEFAVKARFDSPDQGSGERLTGRVCRYGFVRTGPAAATR